MIIRLDSVAKRYQTNLILQDVNAEFHKGTIYGIKGENGSGKSTFLQLVSSVLTPSEGTITYLINQQEINHELIRHQIGLYSPTTQFLLNQTVDEILRFHFRFRSFIPDYSIDDLLEIAFLNNAKSLKYGELSSGMQQRLKLAIAFFSDSDFLLLDEPTSNLDHRGIDYFYGLMDSFKLNRGILIASNEQRDFQYCSQLIDIQEFKPN